MSDEADAWERNAGWWQREFTDGADPEYEEQILPLVDRHLGDARRVLDVGCGEGQVARRLAAEGVEVMGLDRSGAQIARDGGRGGGPRCARATADALPVGDSSVDAVLACLALEHVADLSAAVREIAR